uniref:Ig-like domain-containing protein n=1 Tax=Astyanax mexicanus TaxID=7994 RepID=A0A8B9H080_ASTMX
MTNKTVCPILHHAQGTLLCSFLSYTLPKGYFYILHLPAETLIITCRVSGASITDSSSHFGTAWIRQPAGKTLEWINTIDFEEDIYAKDSLKNKFSVSRETSSNTITLRGENLQTEDTAVYYCARRAPQCCKISAETYKNSLNTKLTFKHGTLHWKLFFLVCT